MRDAVRLAHAAGAGIRCCNVLPRNGEIDKLPAYLELVQDAGADALIVADLGVLSLTKRMLPLCGAYFDPDGGGEL